MSGSRPSPLQRWIIAICLIGGVLLAIIGVRYLLVPESAAFTFGVADAAAGPRAPLHHRPAQRLARAAGDRVCHSARNGGRWRFGSASGTVVCFADAAIAATSSGRLPQVAFHIGCGIVCLALTVRRSCASAGGRAEPVAAIDVGFVLAVVAFGWGLSLATYRVFARPRGWPMGVWQDGAARPADPARPRCACCWPPLFALARGAMAAMCSAPPRSRCSAWPGRCSGPASCASARRARCCWRRPRPAAAGDLAG